MVEIFDRLQKERHPLVVMFGPNLGIKRKATWIEASIWRQHGKACLSGNATNVLSGLFRFLTGVEEDFLDE